MKIEHAALWTRNLEDSREFYTEFFQGKAGIKYTNPKTGFQSYFISFDDGARLEIMHMPNCSKRPMDQLSGFSHIAFSAGSIEAVVNLTAAIKARNFSVVREPGFTGDGYYESCVLDADNNRIEITE